MSHPTAAQGFRDRLERVMRTSGLNQARFARQIGVDRSTLSQLLSSTHDRLPRAETLVAIAKGSRLSVDWLLGLSQREQVGAELVEAPFAFEAHDRAPLNDRFLDWMSEANGRKTRTVPMTFPDFLKTPDVLTHEYGPGFSTGALFEERRARFVTTIFDGAEVEACFPRQAVESFVRGEAQWAGLSTSVRREQLEALADQSEKLYPALRLFLYEMRETYSAPFTVFGQSRAAIFVGPGYFVLNSSEHIRMLSRRFDDLIRTASVQPHAFSSYAQALLAEI